MLTKRKFNHICDTEDFSLVEDKLGVIKKLLHHFNLRIELDTKVLNSICKAYGLELNFDKRHLLALNHYERVGSDNVFLSKVPHLSKDRIAEEIHNQGLCKFFARLPDQLRVVDE